jgi:CRP-like cAMP-binding protein
LHMDSTFHSIEKTVPRLRSGNLLTSPTESKYVRKSDKHETVFSKESTPYLQAFINGKNIQAIILESYKTGAPINFEVLKETLTTLYWSKNLSNAKEFSDAIEFSDWLPVNESALIGPLVEIDVKRGSLITQLLTIFVPVAIILIAYKLFDQPDPLAITFLLFPAAFFSLKGILSAVISTALNSHPQLLSLQISKFGIYAKESSATRSKTAAKEYILHLVTTLGLAAALYNYFVQSENEIFHSYGPLLTILITALLTSPAHKTDVSNYFRVSNKFTPLFSLSVALFFALALIFFGEAFLKIGQALKDWHTDNIIPLTIIVLTTYGFFIDFLDDIDFIFNQIADRILSPIRPVKIDVPSVIKNVPIFQSLPEPILQEMTRTAKIHNLGSGMTLFKEGQNSTDLYYIIDGRIGIYKTRPNKTKFQVLQLAKDSIFGEGGFFLNQPRSGDAVTLQPTKILRIKRPEAIKPNSTIPLPLAELFQKKIWAFQSLSHSKVFKNTPSELLMQIVNGGHLFELPPNQTILKQNDLSDSVWVVIEGECRAVTDNTVKGDLKDGDVFGEIGVIWNTRRTATIFTTKLSILLRIEAIHMYQIMSSNLNLAVSLQNLGAERLHP